MPNLKLNPKSLIKYSLRHIRFKKNAIKSYLKRTLYPVKWKEEQELGFWLSRKKQEGDLFNHHYQKFYTSHFGIQDSFYTGKSILDIGCGPRGSLEWADMAMKRIGVDTLVNEYRKLGADKHKMDYVQASAENLPFSSGEFDAVFSFNSIDHVRDVKKSIQEIKRVLKPGGIFLVIVEANHPPQPCEPHKISPRLMVNLMGSEFTCEAIDLFDPSIVSGCYQSIEVGKKISDPLNSSQIGWLTAKFVKK